MRSASRRNSAIFSVRKNCLAILVGIALTSNVCAQQPAATAQYAIPSGDLIQVVNEISRSSGFQIVYDIELLKGKHAVAVDGSLSLQQALSKALSGTGLTYEIVDSATVVIRKAVPSKPSENPQSRVNRADNDASATQDNVEALDTVTVTGTRIRGGITPSPVITIDSRRIREERSEEHTSELQSLMRISYAVFCLKKK